LARVLLVNSPGNETGEMPSRLGRWIPGEQLGLAYLAATLRNDNHATEIFDACMLGLTVQDTVANINSRADQFDLVGISIADGKQQSAAECLTLLKDLPPRVHLTIGGPTATLCAEEFLRQFARLDTVVCGEGEAALNELCKRLDNDQPWANIPGLAFLLSTTAAPLQIYQANPGIRLDPDTLLFPTRDNIELCREQGFVVSIETSRGCKGRCTFCAARMAYGKPGSGWYARSAESVLGELEQLITTHNVRRVSFEDEDFLGWGEGAGFERAREIAHGILNRKLNIEFSFLTRVDNIGRDLLALLKQAGLRFIFLGVETESQQSLVRFGKQTCIDQNNNAIKILRELDIDHEILFIMYEPDGTLEDVKENLKILEQVDKLNVNLLEPLRVYHGTALQRQMEKQGRLQGNFLSYSYQYQDNRVEHFQRHANRGLSGYYGILRHMDALRWNIREDNDLSRAMVQISKQIHRAAAIWLHKLMHSIENNQDPEPLQSIAISTATEIAELLKELVESWPVFFEPPERGAKSCR